MVGLKEIVEKNDFVIMDTCAFCPRMPRIKTNIESDLELDIYIDHLNLIGDLLDAGAPLFISEGVFEETNNYGITKIRIKSELKKPFYKRNPSYRASIQRENKLGNKLKNVLSQFKDSEHIISLNSENPDRFPRLAKLVYQYAGELGEVDKNLLHLSGIRALKGQSTGILSRDGGIESAWIRLLYDADTVRDDDLSFYWTKSPGEFERIYHKRFHPDRR
jgi:hypothetical protein